VQFALFQIALPNALILNGQQQAALVGDAKLPEQPRHQQGQRVDAGERHLGACQCGQPGGKEIVVGERGEQDALVLASRFFVPERDRCRQRGVEEELPELARDNRRTIGTPQEGNRFEVETLVRDVDQDREDALRVCREIAGKRLLPGFAVVERGLVGQHPGLPAAGRHLMGAEVKKVARTHGAQVLILLMTS
jgi:hypothetical protein